jgi:cellobiose phosphorylase
MYSTGGMNLEDGAIKGVRTRISDDLLWLPYTVWEYVEGTGDEGILKEEIPYLSSPPLEEGEQERYEEPGLSGDRGSVLEHAIRAVDLVLERGSGAHGLALMGAGDWNDGMNLVGAEGRGESVWLTWFLALVLDRMAGLLGEAQGEPHAGPQEYGRAPSPAGMGSGICGGFMTTKHMGSSRDTACQLDSIAHLCCIERLCDASGMSTVASAVERLTTGGKSHSNLRPAL